ncbi:MULTISPECIES: alpha/beta fold hydrolase [Rhodanobacter]|nr:alpha/beta hydrolase [Rhodanobacter sp. 7MK24]
MRILLTIMLAAAAAAAPAHAATLRHGWQSVDGVHIFYREGGPPEAPTVVFLPGNPLSSIQYEKVMEDLAAVQSLHVISLDYPSFGYSDAPSPGTYAYTFDHLAETVRDFLKARGIARYALYMQDYGVPVGFRLICANPTAITAIVVQNGVIHLDGFPAAQDPHGELRSHWVQRNAGLDSRRAAYARSLGYPQAGWNDEEQVGPDVMWLAASAEQRPGVIEARNDLWFDYGSNVARYPAWQAQLRRIKAPLLVLWGKRDSYFTTPGAYAYRRDVPSAEVHILDADHFATLQIPDRIAALLGDFLQRHHIVPTKAPATGG